MLCKLNKYFRTASQELAINISNNHIYTNLYCFGTFRKMFELYIGPKVIQMPTRHGDKIRAPAMTTASARKISCGRSEYKLRGLATISASARKLHYEPSRQKKRIASRQLKRHKKRMSRKSAEHPSIKDILIRTIGLLNALSH